MVHLREGMLRRADHAWSSPGVAPARLRTAWCALVVLCTSACSSNAPTRDAWLVEQLYQDNLVWLQRDPALLSGKYAKMAADPYDFMRGTSAIFFRDLARAGTSRGAPLPITIPEANEVLLVGDPHPENIGAYLPTSLLAQPTQGLRLEFNDLDAAGHGPYTWDLRRGAAGLAVLLSPSDVCPPASCSRAVLEAYAEAYLDEITALATGALPQDPVLSPTLDDVSQALLTRARAEGQQTLRLLEETNLLTVGDPTFALTDGLNATGNGLLRLTPEEARVAIQLLEQLDTQDAGPRSESSWTVHDVARRFGQGVSSFPALRYVVLWSYTDDPDNMGLFQLREVVDPTPIPGSRGGIEGVFATQGQRIVDASRRLWAADDADPWLSSVEDGPRTFKVTAWDSYYQGFNHEDILQDLEDKRFGTDDLVAWGRTLGALLAGSHARGGTFDGGSSLEAIAADLDPVMVERIVDNAQDDAEQILADYQTFLDALQELGPLLESDQVTGGVL